MILRLNNKFSVISTYYCCVGIIRKCTLLGLLSGITEIKYKIKIRKFDMITKFQLNQLELQLSSIFDSTNIVIGTKDYVITIAGKNGYNPQHQYSLGHNHPKTIMISNSKYHIAITEMGQGFEDPAVNRQDIFPAYKFKSFLRALGVDMPLWLREAQIINIFWGMPKREWVAFMSDSGTVYSLERVLVFPGEEPGDASYHSNVVHKINFGYEKPELAEIESNFQFRFPNLDVTLDIKE
jgi:hypothetical protein